ncbi:MAG TPA: LLM class flavin-dependent oxidoreductase, partial [Acidimicrobiales bacterium]
MTKFGVHLGLQDASVVAMRQAWEMLDGSAFSWLSVTDRVPASLSAIEVHDGVGTLEAVACQAAVAVTTLRTRVGCLAYSAAYRHPAALAKAGATIDHLSGGRLELGIGAGRRRRGDAVSEDGPLRLRRMAECAEVVRLLWTEESTTFEGEFFQLRNARCDPKPVQRPPRIWVGTNGGPAALEIAGRVGDGWNAAFIAPDDFARKLAVVKSAAVEPSRLATAVTLGYLPRPEDEVVAVLVERFGPGAARLQPGVVAGSIDSMLGSIARYVAA